MARETQGADPTPNQGTARQASQAQAQARARDRRPLLSVIQVADQLGVSRHTVYRIIERKELRTVTVHIRGSLRIHPSDLDRYLGGTSPMLSVAQAAEDLGVGRQTVYRMIREGELKSRRVGEVIKVPESELDRILCAGEETVA